MSDGKKKERDVGFFCLSLPTPPTVHSIFKSDMAGRINDRKLLTLIRPNKTPALQARSNSYWNTSTDKDSPVPFSIMRLVKFTAIHFSFFPE